MTAATPSRSPQSFAAEQFIGWFIKDYVEAVAAMSGLLTVVTRTQHNVEQIKGYVACNADSAAAPDA